MSIQPLHPADESDERLLAACRVRRLRRSGPGGQHRNKVETAVVLRHEPTGLEAEANERRSQAENRRQALRRLRIRLALEVRCARRDAEVPSPRWQARVGPRGRLAIGADHADFAPLLAEALDVLADCDYDLPAAALRLGVSGSQLARLVKMQPRAWQQVNDQRRLRHLRPLA